MAKGALNVKAMDTSKLTIQTEKHSPSKRLKRLVKFLEIIEVDKAIKEGATVLAPDEGELLVLQRVLHAMEGSMEEGQRKHIFHS